MRIVFTLGMFGAAAVGLTAVLGGSRPSARTYFGPKAAIGDGAIQSYVTLGEGGAPTAVGVSITAGGLQQLPDRMNTESRCYDLDGNGAHTSHECMGDYEHILGLPDTVAGMATLPFKWISVNWNAEGHKPPAPPAYAEPHFDFHFYAVERDRIEAIGPGRCGELVDCEDFKRGSEPVPAAYLPAGHIDVGAVVPRMGNHLVDSRSPELQDPPARFTRTFIYGAFDGELIFWEPMITLDFLSRASDECFAISQPERVRRSGYYPTVYCVRHNEREDRHTVSLEGFVYAETR